MHDRARDDAAVDAIARAIRRALPARSIERLAAGWSNLFLAALRADPEGRGVVAAALLDEQRLASALQTTGIVVDRDAVTAARDLIAAMEGFDRS